MRTNRLKRLKNRKIAILVTVVVVVLATFLGVVSSVGNHVRNIEAMFYDGVYLDEEGFTEPGINSHLENSANAALGFSMLMADSVLGAEAEALAAARRELLAADSISEKYTANENMRLSFSVLLTATERLELTDREMEAIERYASSFAGAQTAIERSGYNMEVKNYLDDVSVIAQLFMPFVFASPPQLFG